MSVWETSGDAVVNDVRIHYAAAGRGRCVLLLHGNGEDHHLFDCTASVLLSAGYRVLAPDSRGHGRSQGVKEFHYADMAEDVRALIRALGLCRPAVYGHSDGGIIALLAALSHPGLFGPMALSGVNLSPAGLDGDFIKEYEGKNRLHPDPLVTLMLTEPHIDAEELKRITVPVLLTAGERDLIRREETERIAAALPGARLVTVEGADHGSYIQNSPVMGDMLCGFLKDCGYGAAAEGGEA